ncbi:hypothetical protein HD554DRAFT_2315383, partial [Boletus coccyginus]
MSVALQALAVISMGSIADRRKSIATNHVTHTFEHIPWRRRGSHCSSRLHSSTRFCRHALALLVLAPLDSLSPLCGVRQRRVWCLCRGHERIPPAQKEPDKRLDLSTSPPRPSTSMPTTPSPLTPTPSPQTKAGAQNLILTLASLFIVRRDVTHARARRVHSSFIPGFSPLLNQDFSYGFPFTYRDSHPGDETSLHRESLCLSIDSFPSRARLVPLRPRLSTASLAARAHTTISVHPHIYTRQSYDSISIPNGKPPEARRRSRIFFHR